MYKILIKYSSKIKPNLWEVYGTTTTTTSGKTTFVEYETDDIDELTSEMLKLDEIYGYENIKVVSDVKYVVGIDLATLDINDDNTNETDEDSSDIAATEDN